MVRRHISVLAAAVTALVGLVLTAGVAPASADPDLGCHVNGVAGSPTAYSTLTPSITFSGGTAAETYYTWYISSSPSDTGTSGTSVSAAKGVGTYSPTAADVGKYLHLSVFGSHNIGFPGGYVWQCESSPQLIAKVPVPVATAPAVAGTTKKGKTVTAATGTLPIAVTVGYQWLRQKKKHVAVPIPGATGPTYKLRSKDRSKKITVQVTYTRPGNDPTVLTSPGRKVR